MANLVIFDWDWTLARGENTTPEKPFRHTGERYVWMEDAEGRSRGEALEWLYKEDGYYIAICTNQGGISYGLGDYDETEAAMWGLLRQFDWPIPFLICPYHPAGQHAINFKPWENWRKPKPGMLLRLWHLFPDVKGEDVIVVGDREEDEGAAKGAGMKFEWADAFFKQVFEAMQLHSIQEKAQDEALEELLNNASPASDDFPF